MAQPATVVSKRPAAKKHAANPGNAIAGVTISHPDKVLWPATGNSAPVTKLDLARYYELAALRMLPHIERRPISMVRAPEGIKGQQFFQRHVLAGVAHVLP